MKLADTPENQAAIRSLVSREVIATVSAFPTIVRIEGACARNPLVERALVQREAVLGLRILGN